MDLGRTRTGAYGESVALLEVGGEKTKRLEGWDQSQGGLMSDEQWGGSVPG